MILYIFINLNINRCKLKVIAIYSYHTFYPFFLLFSESFHALIQFLHFPPFLKCEQSTKGYLLDFELVLETD